MTTFIRLQTLSFRFIVKSSFYKVDKYYKYMYTRAYTNTCSIDLEFQQ